MGKSFCNSNDNINNDDTVITIAIMNKIMRPVTSQAWTNYDADRERKASDTRPNFRARTFCLVKKKKPLDLQVFSRIDKTNEKVTVNSKYYNEH